MGRIAVFVDTENGVDRVVPGGTGLAETEAAIRLYGDLREEIVAFERAVRQRLKLAEPRPKKRPPALSVT